MTRSVATVRPVSRVLDVAVCMALVAASLVLTSFHIRGHKEISPFDEYVYIDYYARVLDEGVVREGSLTGDYTRRYVSCHPNRVFGPLEPKRCGPRKARPDAAYPLAGRTTADLYPPIFFYSIRIAAQPLVWLGVDFVEAGRYATSLWLVLAVILLYVGLRRMGAAIATSAAGCLVMMSSPGAYAANTYISTDATALAAGAGFLLLTLRYLEQPTGRRRGALWAAAAVFGLMKIQNLEAVSISAMMILLTALVEPRPISGRPFRRRWSMLAFDRRVITAIGAVTLGALAQFAWLVIRSLLTVGPEPDFGAARAYQFPGDLFSDLFAFLLATPQPGTAGALQMGLSAALSVKITTLLLPVGVFAAAFAASVPPIQRRLGWSVIVIAIVAGPVLTGATLLSAGGYLSLPDRYGLPILPAVIACLVMLPSQRSRAVKVGAVTLGLVLYACAATFAQ